MTGIERPALASGDSPAIFDVFWAGKTPGDVEQEFGDLAAEITFGLAPVSRNFVHLYAYQGGNYPYAGPHLIKLDPEYMALHFEKLELHMDNNIPDPEFDGFADVHYEKWHPLWVFTKDSDGEGDEYAEDLDFQTDWREYIEEHESHLLVGLDEEEQETLFKETYEETTRDFLLETLGELKRLRPNTRWSFDQVPDGIYTRAQYTAPGVFGYGDLTYEASDIMDELQWLWDEVDFLISNQFQYKMTVPDGVTPDYDNAENDIWMNDEYMTTNVLEKLRLATGKPVFVKIWLKYGGQQHFGTLLSDINRNHSFELPLLAGADGVVIWCSVFSEAEQNSLQNYISTYVVLEIRRLYQNHDVIPSQYKNLPSWIDGPHVVTNPLASAGDN